jgi:cell division transport system permease protein
MNSRQDLPLKSDIAARFVPKIVALMVYLGTLCFIFTLFMIHSTHSWESQFISDLSIEIPTFPGIPSSALQSRVLELLNRTPGIQHASAVPQKEMANLFHSLLGEDVNIDLLSMPVIIDVVLNGKEKVDIQNLEEHLKNISPDIQLLDQRGWQSQVSRLIRTGVVLASMVTFLILCAALATTTFATHTSLLIHRQIIEVLSLIGATNSYIANQFQINALKQGLLASALGSFLAFLTFLGIVILLEKAGLPFIISSTFFFQSICIFMLAPFLTAFSMMLSTRWAVMRALRL